MNLYHNSHVLILSLKVENRHFVTLLVSHPRHISTRTAPAPQYLRAARTTPASAKFYPHRTVNNKNIAGSPHHTAGCGARIRGPHHGCTHAELQCTPSTCPRVCRCVLKKPSLWWGITHGSHIIITGSLK